MSLTIGKLAKQANVTVETIRHYQRIGLVEEPTKPPTGFRQYPLETLTKLRFIKRAQQAGFTLKEISALLKFDNAHCQDVQKLAKDKCQQIDQQLKNLTTLRQVLDDLVKSCEQEQSSQHCSIIDAFSNYTNSKP